MVMHDKTVWAHGDNLLLMVQADKFSDNVLFLRPNSCPHNMKQLPQSQRPVELTMQQDHRTTQLKHIDG